MLSKGKEYIKTVTAMLDRIIEDQAISIDRAAELITSALLEDHALFAYGNVHSAFTIGDLYIRAGGLALFNQITAPVLSSLEYDPASLWVGMERLEGYGKLIFETTPAKAGDVLMVVSTSGRNAVPIEIAQHARSGGLQVIVLTSLQYTLHQPSRHSSGKRLYEFADVVIDNYAVPGDAALKIEGLAVPFCPTSGVIDTAILQTIMAEVIERLVKAGANPPVYIAGNLDGYDEYRAIFGEAVMRNKHRIFYTPLI
jgi:uncharacterized phosphosugar-binding protein